MSEINLKNPKLRNYIRGALNTNKFGEPFATLLEEVFLREVYVLDLSPEELLEDINVPRDEHGIIKDCKSIYYVDNIINRIDEILYDVNIFLD